MTPTLSLLIPSIKTRAAFLERMLGMLQPQLTPAVEVLTDVDEGSVSVGAKRNRLMSEAAGEWIAFVDDDDVIAETYVARILAALKQEPDVVGFRMLRYQDGRLQGEESASLANGPDYVIDDRDPNWIVWRYPPVHLCPHRRELVKHVPFAPINTGEDSHWQRRVYPLLDTEIYINEVLYHYYYRTTRPGEVTHRLRTWRR